MLYIAWQLILAHETLWRRRTTFGFYEGGHCVLLYGSIHIRGRKFLADGEGYASAVEDEMAMHTVRYTGYTKAWSHKHWRTG